MKSSLKNIHEAGLGKRLIAMIMDGAVFAFTAVALALWVFTPIVNKTMHYQDYGVQGLKYQVFSKLYVAEELNEEDGSKKVIEVTKFEETTGNLVFTPLYNYITDDLDFYKERLHYYYTSYKTGENLEVPEEKNPEEYRSPEYNVTIFDSEGHETLPKDYYTDAWFSNFIDGKTTQDDFRNLSYDSVKDMWESEYFSNINKKIKNCQMAMVLPAFFTSYLAFYMLIPLLYRNGETFGKKVMHIGLATKDGYGVKKRQVVFRQTLLLLWITLSLFAIGIGLTSIATLGVGVVIYLVATAISKTKRSPIDYAAYTYMIDTDKSVWFKDPEEEAKKEKELEEKMSKYRRYEPDNSHVIQIGSEIVNEEIKKEIEKENLKKLKK